MAKSQLKTLPSRLAECSNEEEVKAEFCKAFGYKLDARDHIDMYTPRILFEFKYDRNLRDRSSRAKIIAQSLYYLRRIKFGKTDKVLPPYLCIVDKDQAFIVESSKFKSMYASEQDNYDWDRAPSTPCPNLIQTIQKSKQSQDIEIHEFRNAEDFENFHRVIQTLRTEQLELPLSSLDKKEISEFNFDSAFKLWEEHFGPYVVNGRKTSEYFLADLKEGNSKTISETNEIEFTLNDGSKVKRPLPVKEYENFWLHYERIPNTNKLHAIRQKMDRITLEDFRRFTGEFFTPIEFAEKGLEYIEKVAGPEWWNRNFRLWDMSAGTGNLEYLLPEQAMKACYISTLLEDDANYCKKLYPTANVFQYDYLNDDVEMLFDSRIKFSESNQNLKLPEQLIKELADPDFNWIIFINPPFATSNVGSRSSEVSKDTVSHTKVREMMTGDDLGETSRELFSQFLWRISKEFENKKAYLGMFSKLKYINAHNDQRLRDTFFQYEFRRGFCFPAKVFHGNKGDFPVGFLVWDLSKSNHLQNQRIQLDIFNESAEKIGVKDVPSVDRDDTLNKWIVRPETTRVLPPLTNAITVALKHKDVRDRVAEDFLFSLMAKGNDFANQNFTSLLSGPYVSAGALSVVESNFEQAMVVHAVRRLPKATWLNDRDQWLQPINNQLPADFVNKCVIWSLFSNSNQTASLTNIKYRGNSYDLKNELFPFSFKEIAKWKISLGLLRDSLSTDSRDRYANIWLNDRELDSDSALVLKIALEVYRNFFELSASVPWPKFKISNWDVGWYQVRRSLEEIDEAEEELQILSKAHKSLGELLLPDFYKLGFMPSAEEFFA